MTNVTYFAVFAHVSREKDLCEILRLFLEESLISKHRKSRPQCMHFNGLQMILTILLAVLASALFHVLIRTLYVRGVRASFKQNARGIQLIPFSWLPCGNFYEIFFDWKILSKLGDWHKKYGKTFGWMFGSQPVVFSTDLDLIKTMVIDESVSHINRIKFLTPLDEYEHDNISLANGDQWRRIRRAIAPVFT